MTRSRYKSIVISTRIGQDKISLQTYSGLYKDWSRQDLATNLQWSLQGLVKTRSRYKPTVVSARIGQNKILETGEIREMSKSTVNTNKTSVLHFVALRC